ncbi:hypothetical protein U1Q18_048460 [Sarracenia purpurea var. burkii]
MALLEGLSANLKLIDSKKNSFRNAILLLALQWKDLDEHLVSTGECVEECIGEIELREKNLNSVRESVLESNRELDLIRKSIESRVEEFEDKETEFLHFQQMQIEGFELKMKQLSTIRKSADERIEEVVLREERLSEQHKLMESRLKEIDSIQNWIEMRAKELDTKEKQLNSVQKLNEERCKELELKAREIDSAQILMEEWAEKLDSKEKQLNSVKKLNEGRYKELELKAREIDSTQTLIDERVEKLDLKEKQLNSVQKLNEERCKELELKAREIDFAQTLIEERAEKLDSKEKQLNSVKKLNEGRCKELELKAREIDSTQTLIEERAEKLDSKEKQLNSVQKLNEERCKELELKAREIDSTQTLIEERAEKLDSKEKQLNSVQKLNEERCKELELKAREIDSAPTLIEERAKLDSKEKQLNSVQNFISQCFKDYQSKNKQLKSDQKLLGERVKEVESKEKKIEELTKELELKTKQFDSVLHSHVKVENMDDISAENVGICSSADIRFHVTLDGRSLQLFLNEHESMSSEAYRGLQLSSDPAKLVLDALEGFYPPHLKKGDVEFEEVVVRRSCILLLDHLMKISPQIQPCVKEEALKLAGEWKAKMRVVPDNFLEVLGFMQLLASYKLASNFDTDELLEIFAVVAEHKQAPELCRILGFTEKVPDLIETFVKKKQHTVAVKFIYAFELVDKFPPVPLLKNYLKYSRKVFYNIWRMRKLSSEGQDRANWAIEERIASIRAVIKCIVDHNLESEFSSENLERLIGHLLIQKEDNKPTKPAYCINAQASQNIDNKFISSATSPICPNASSASILVPTTPTLACIIADMDGMNLQLFLNEHLEEHEWMHREVCDALHMSFDSGMLVLDAMQGFYPPHSKKGSIDIEASVIRKSCIFLLEILMSLSPQIKPKVKEAAKKLAVDWKANIVVENKNQLAILGFLLLVGTYGLASVFDSNELLNLFKTVSKHRYAPALSGALGLSRDLGLSQALGSSRDLDLSQTVCISEKIPGEVPGPIQFASDPAKLVLDAMQACYRLNHLVDKHFKAGAMKSFELLLRKLSRVSLEIKTHVKEDAMRFAADWKAKVIKNQNISEVWLFLFFVAIYKLAPSFDMNELFGLLDIIHNRRQATHLFRALGLADEVPKFIERLIQRGLHLHVIRYIDEFDLIDEFPPISVLKGYLSYAEEAAEKICMEGHNSLQAQDEARKKVVGALKQVIKCIRFHGLESQHLSVELKAIEQLLKGGKKRKRNCRRVAAPSSASKARAQEEGHLRAAMPFSSSDSQTIGQNGKKKRSSPIHDHVVYSQLPVKKLCQEAISEGVATNNPIGTSLPPLPTQLPPYNYQPDILAAETGPSLTPLSGHYSLNGSTPAPPHMSHLPSQKDLGGFPPFSSAGSHFGSAPNFVARPPIVARSPYSSWSDPNQTCQNYSGTAATTVKFQPFSSVGTHFGTAYNFAPSAHYPWPGPNQNDRSDLRR